VGGLRRASSRSACQGRALVVPARRAVLWAALAAVVTAGVPLGAQEAPQRLPWVVLDLHGTVLRFPDAAQLAESRLLNRAELPGMGLGGDVGLHVYPVRWSAVTFGIGGQLSFTEARSRPETRAGDGSGLRPVTERFASLAPQLSLNFGRREGWSYLSGGVGRSVWSIVPDGVDSLPPDRERLKTVNYGGGARWFAKPHLAFSFDLRFYGVNPSRPTGSLPSGPRTTLMVVGAGISIK
jgi:hypothetical protein